MLGQTSIKKQHQSNSTGRHRHQHFGLPEDVELEIKESFNLFDPNQTSAITYH